MHYEENIKKAKPLSAIYSDEDIAELSSAVFPGTHCPLFGALLAASYIKDLAVLNIGTQECTFYGKDFSRLRQGGTDCVYSYVLSKNDVTFGASEKIADAVSEIIALESPKALLLISTCVMELIGEDIAAVAQALDAQYSLPVLYVKTEHFKCNSHMPGLMDTLAALVHVMTPMPQKEKTVNVLGHRFDDFHRTELAKVLSNAGVEVHMSIPSQCTVEQLKAAGEAALNIVTDFTALPLAKAMAEKLGQPYVVFDKHLLPERITACYKALSEALAVDLTQWVTASEAACQTALEAARKQFEGKTFIYGNTPMKALECTHFMATLGMAPLWVQMRELYDDDAQYQSAILTAGHDPKVSRIANIVPMRELYGTLKPDYYIGHENPMFLMEKGIVQLTFDREAGGLGYQLPMAVVEKMKTAGEMPMKMMIKGGGH